MGGDCKFACSSSRSSNSLRFSAIAPWEGTASEYLGCRRWKYQTFQPHRPMGGDCKYHSLYLAGVSPQILRPPPPGGGSENLTNPVPGYTNSGISTVPPPERAATP